MQDFGTAPGHVTVHQTVGSRKLNRLFPLEAYEVLRNVKS